MTPILTEQQLQALDAQPDVPVRVVDPRTDTGYVLVRADLYEKVKALLEDEEFDVRQAYPLMDAVASQEGWDDPEMDSYNSPDSGRKDDHSAR